MNLYKNYLKRVLDFIVVLIALLFIWPLLLFFTLLLHIANKGAGAFYHSKRVGMGEREFAIYKFKSMTDQRNENGELLPDSQRITTIGRVVRSLSIDELPQLLNVLKGDMSLVGPRPLPAVYLPYYTKEDAKRHSVRPGITGWAQVNGRKNITWDHKLECDVYYVNNCSFLFDMKILWLTCYKVIKRDGVGVETSGVVSLYDTRGIQRPELAHFDPKRDERKGNRK